MVTIRQIAEASGYSKASVWMALNGNKRLPAKTRDKIMQIATQLGYSPNPAYRAMLRQVRAGKPIEYKSTLALVHGFDFPDPEVRNKFHAELVEGFTQRAAQFGYKVEKYWLNDPAIRISRLESIMKARGIKGIVCMPLPEHREIQINLDNFAMVAIAFTVLNPGLNRVEMNNEDATSLCIQKLYEHGYKKIGFVHRKEFEPWRDYTLSAPYLWALSKLDPQEHSTIFYADEQLRKPFLRWWKAGKFDSLIVNHEIVIDWLKEEGVSIPEDVGIVLPTPVRKYENFSHVNQHPQRVGAAAADVLMSQVERGETGVVSNPKVLTTDVSWQDGISLRQVAPPRPWYNLHD